MPNGMDSDDTPAWVKRTRARASQLVDPFSAGDNEMKARFNAMNPIEAPPPKSWQQQSSMKPYNQPTRPSQPLLPMKNVPPEPEPEAYSRMTEEQRKERDYEVAQADIVRRRHDARLEKGMPLRFRGGRRRKSRKSRKPRKTKRRKSKKTKRRRTKRRR